MEIARGILMVLLGLTAIFLILLVLIQRGRGGGLAGAFGGMGGQSAFGTKAGDLFTRVTIVTAAVWIVLCALSVKIFSSAGDLLGADAGTTSESAPGPDGERATPAGKTDDAAKPATPPASGKLPAKDAAAPAEKAPAAKTAAEKAPAESTPAPKAPAGSAPTGSAPAGSAPTGSAPTGSASDGQCSDRRCCSRWKYPADGQVIACLWRRPPRPTAGPTLADRPAIRPPRVEDPLPCC